MAAVRANVIRDGELQTGDRDCARRHHPHRRRRHNSLIHSAAPLNSVSCLLLHKGVDKHDVLVTWTQESRAEHAASKVRRTLCDRFKGDEETDLKQTTNAIFPTT
jgi:hypothetical protein